MNQRRWGWLLLMVCASIGLWRVSSETGWLAVSLTVWLMALASPGPIRRLPGAGAWAAWIAWSAVSAAGSQEPLLSISRWWLDATFVAVLFMAYAWWGGAHRRAWAGLGSLLVLALGAWSAARGGSSAQAQAGALLAAVAAGSVGALAFSGREAPDVRVRSAACALAAAALALLLWLVPERGVWFGLLACSTVLLFRRGLLWMPPALLCLAAAFWAARPSAGLWGPAMDLAASYPVTGVGPGLLARSLGPLQVPLPAGLAAETGVFGAALFAWALASSRPRSWTALGWPERAAAAAAAALLLESCVDGALGSPALRLLFFAAVAVSAGPARVYDIEQPRLWEGGRVWRKPAWFGALGLALTAVFWAPRQALRSAARSWVSPEREVRLAGYESVLRIAPLDEPARLGLAREHLLGRPSRPGAALHHLDVLLDRKPGDPVLRLMKGEIFASLDDWTTACGEAARAASADPSSSGAALMMSECRLRRGDVAGARRSLAAAERLRARTPGHWDAWRHGRIRALLLRRHAP